MDNDVVEDHYKKQINVLADFIMDNYSDKITGSAVETAIQIIKDQEEKIAKKNEEIEKYRSIIAYEMAMNVL